MKKRKWKKERKMREPRNEGHRIFFGLQVQY